MILKKLREIQKHTDKQNEETRKTTQDMNEKFTEKIDRYKKKNQPEILELKISLNERLNISKSFNNRPDQAE